MLSSSDSSDDENTSSQGEIACTGETVTGDGIVARDDGVDVPSIDRTEFESWEDLESYLAVYWRRTYQVQRNYCHVSCILLCMHSDR
jgi:hypothetical protein